MKEPSIAFTHEDFKILKGLHMSRQPERMSFGEAYEKAEMLALRDVVKIHMKEVFARRKAVRKASRSFRHGAVEETLGL